MGMAASQARYLGLTARKTNTEYEGQQINQERTALANQSAGLFNQLMTLAVPVPPSVTDYSTTQYTFNDGDNANTVTDIKTLSGDPNYNATVSYYYNQDVYKGVTKTRTDLGVNYVTDASGSTYWLTNGATGGTATNQTKLSQCTTTETSYATDKAALAQIIKDNPTTTTQLAADVDYDPDNQTVGDVTGAWKYTNSNGVTYYYANTSLASYVASNPDGSALATTGFYASTVSEKQNVSEKAYVTKADSGRYSTIQLASEPDNTVDLTATATTDNAAYNNAMNEYNYQVNSYEKQVQDINAKTSVIQEEDRTLELRLKQLDTEQEALSTEMDAVKKVIDKNIEQTFKTFA